VRAVNCGVRRNSIGSNRLVWAGHVARMRKAYRTLVGNVGTLRPLAGPRLVYVCV
jgi:hypothetical protein